MAKDRFQENLVNSILQLVIDVVQKLMKQPNIVRIPVFAILLVTVVLFTVSGCPTAGKNSDWKKSSSTSTSGPPMDPANLGKPGTYMLCSWNVENFYDDQDDSKNHDDMENWYGTTPAAFQLKVDRLSDALLMMNEGHGPDIASLVEVESLRCMEALRDRINEKLRAKGEEKYCYGNVVFKPDNSGRRFAPGILTRLPVLNDKTRKLGGRSNGRILEAHLEVNGHELVIIAAHWTSRVTDKDDDGTRRIAYAEDCYGRYRAILAGNPDADVIICGDFNDTFDDASMQKGLRASSNSADVRASKDEPKPLALFATAPSSDPKGTIYGKSRWSIFDHICISRGLLGSDNQAWKYEEGSQQIFAPKELRNSKGRTGEPLRFGSPKNSDGTEVPDEKRGYSDHFPITVKLSVAGSSDVTTTK